jgi:hypothetical protein
MPKTLSEWFCLRPDRHSFKPNVIRDRELVFCHEAKIQEEIMTSIERRFAARHPVKMVLYGDWGVGKTHTVYHISWWFEQHTADFPAQTVLVELGDITRKSRFDVLVGPFLDRIGLPELIRLVHAYGSSAGGKHVVAGLKDRGATSNVAEAFGKLLLASPGATPPQAVLTAFEFLKGQKTKDAASMGLGNALSQSEEYYSALLCCGELCRVVNKKQLIFMADEAAKLEDIDADDATRRHWVAANRLVFDDNNDIFGFIYTLSGRGQRSMPTVISDPQIVNRLGANNIIELPNLATTDVETFLEKLRSSFVSRACVDTLADSGDIKKSDYDWKHYPFTSTGWQEFVDYWNNNQEEAKPRDICDKLDDVGFRAMKDSKRLIDPDCLRKARM